MAVSSIKRNILFSAINTFITLAFPLITFPYISRVLMPEGMGQYSFIVSIVGYFILFANLGIPLYATKLIAANRDDPEKLKAAASKVFYINLFLAIFVTIFYIIFVFVDPKGKSDPIIYLVIGLQILAGSLGVEWYFSATEKFGYIALRNLITKIACIALIFIFVKKQSDLILYAIIMSLSMIGYSLINLGKFIKEIRPKLVFSDLKKCIKPILGAFLLYVAAKINDNLDAVMLGYLIGEDSVGLYVSATKVIGMVIGILLVVNTVLLPRIANYISNDKIDEVKALLKKSFSLVLALVIPAAIGLSFISTEAILLLSGPMYAGAINTMRLMSINVFFIVFSNFLGVQVLYAFGHVKSTTISIGIGALINLVLNFILIPKYGYFGAGVTTVLSNMVIFVMEAILVYKNCKFNVINKENIKVIISSGFMTIVLVLLQIFKVCESNLFLSLAIKILSASVVYALMLIITRHSYVLQFLTSFKLKLKTQLSKINKSNTKK